LDAAEALSKVEDPELRTRIEALVRPIVRLHVVAASDEDLAVGASKFGGAPDLPADLVWPTSEYGPVGFVAQLDLADLAATKAAEFHGLPREGGLVLFAAHDWENGVQPGVVARVGDGFAPVPDLCHLFYLPPEVSRVRREPPAELSETEQIYPASRVNIDESWDVPWAGDIGEEDDGDLADLLCGLREHGRGASRVGGWSIHSRTSDTCPGPDWFPVLTLESEEVQDWSWADGERLEVFVHQDDARDASFRRVFGYAS
jgi:uncharacterized protein YwqG